MPPYVAGVLAHKFDLTATRHLWQYDVIFFI